MHTFVLVVASEFFILTMASEIRVLTGGRNVASICHYFFVFICKKLLFS